MYLANTINGIITRNSLKGKDIIGLVGSAVGLFAFFFRRGAGGKCPMCPIDNPPLSIVVPRRFASRPPLVANRNLYYYSLGYLCRKNKSMLLAPPQESSRGDGRIHLTYLKKRNQSLNVLQNCTLQNANPILLKSILVYFTLML